MALVGEQLAQINTGILPKDAFIVIICTQWNAPVVDELLRGCEGVLQQLQMTNYKVLRVPGAFEIPFAVKSYWENYNNKFEKPTVFITLGCVLRGDTPHFDYVCRAVTDGILHLNLTLPVPTVFGVLTVDNETQAQERIGGKHGHKGEEAAFTALKMLELKYGVI